MGWSAARRLAVGLVLIAAHVGVSVAICTFTSWLYFNAGVKWTSDAVLPQIQCVLAFASQCLTALIVVPAAMLAQGYAHHALAFAIGLPLGAAAIPFLMPNIITWLAAIFVLGATGLALLRKPAQPR